MRRERTAVRERVDEAGCARVKAVAEQREEVGVRALAEQLDLAPQLALALAAFGRHELRGAAAWVSMEEKEREGREGRVG